MSDDLLPSAFAEVERRLGDVFDYGDPPEDIRCDCGEVHPWVWWEPGEKYGHMRLRAKYMHPTVNPCPRCRAKVDVAEHFELENRQKVSGVPWRNRRYRLARHRIQAADEPLGEFVADVKRHNGTNKGRPVIGVTMLGVEAFGAIDRWEPGHGSLMLWGPPGTGKTLLLCALATKLLEVPPSQVVDMLEAGRIEEPPTQRARDYMRSRGLNRCTVRQPMASTVRYATTEELAEREALRWKGDPQPQHDVASASVLLLDEVWGERKVSTAEEKGVKRVLDYRYRHGLPTLMASNADPDVLMDDRKCPYGARMADRFAEMLQGSVYEMGGASWRR